MTSTTTQIRSFTLVEFYEEPQVTDGKSWNEQSVLDVNGDLLVIHVGPLRDDEEAAWQNAVGMARFMLGADARCPDCGKEAPPLVSDVDGSISTVCPTHGAFVDDEREPRPGLMPFIGILAHDYDANIEINSLSDEQYAALDPQGWAAGWVGIDGVAHEGDYENDPILWGPTRAYTANVLSDEIDYDLPVGSEPQQVDDTKVVVLYGSDGWATVVVGAIDEDDAIAQIERAFFRNGLSAAVTIDDIDNTTDEAETLALIARVATREEI